MPTSSTQGDEGLRMPADHVTLAGQQVQGDPGQDVTEEVVSRDGRDLPLELSQH